MEGPRAARPGEMPGVLELVNTVFRSKECSMGLEFPRLFDEDNMENLRIILEGSRPVSHVGILEETLLVGGCPIRVGCIGSVATYEGYRGRGYAGLLLRDAMKKLARDGVDYMLVSGGRGLYLRHGCAPAGISYRYRVLREKVGDVEGILGVPLRSRSHLEEYSRGGRVEVGDLARLYQGEPVRYLRSKAEFERAIWTTADKERMGGLERNLVILQEEDPVSYMVIRVPKEEGSKRAAAIEYAGSRLHLLAFLPEVFSRYDLGEMDFAVGSWDWLMQRLFEALGVEGVPNTLLGHTFRVINFPGLMRKLVPYFEERVGRKRLSGFSFRDEPLCEPLQVAPEDPEFNRIFGVRHVFEYRGESMVITDEGALAKLIFGNPLEGVLASGRAIGGLLEELFPIPLAIPGLNYV